MKDLHHHGQGTATAAWAPASSCRRCEKSWRRVERCCLRRRWHCTAPRRSKAAPWGGRGPRGRGPLFQWPPLMTGGLFKRWMPHPVLSPDFFLMMSFFSGSIYLCGLCLPFDQITGGNIRVEDFLGTLSLHFALTQPRATTPATDFVPQLLDDARRVMGSCP